MKKPVKALRRLIVGVIIVLLILIVAIKLYANSAVKWGIETAGKQTLQVDVKVDSASLDILTGTIGLKKLVVDNPEGYQGQNLLDMETGKMQVNAASLLSDTVKIKEIKLDGINVNLEQKDIRGNNIQQVLKNIQQAMQEQPSSQKLLIEILEITNINANVKLSVPGAEEDIIKVPLKTITMTNLGSDNKLDTAKLISEILVAITIAIAEEGGGVIPGDILKPLNSSLEEMGEFKTLLKEGLKILDTDGELGNEIDEITGGLKDLIQQKKDED